MKTELITLHEDRKVTLTAYLQEVGGEFGGIDKRPAVLILPGGGYSMCSDREADPVAFPYLKAGYQAFILRYSVGADSVWPNPLNDYEEAMAMIREKSEEWHVITDRIAVIGFSAGGHLAGCAATMSVNRPNAAILGYPVIDGECVRVYEKTAPDVPSAVDEKTCPCFVFATRTDSLVPISNTVHLLNALTEHEIAFESHIYSNGPHGFTTCDSSVQNLQMTCSRVPHWVEDSIEWLKDVMGDFGNGSVTAPRFGAKLNGNRDEYLNIDCTMGYLMSRPEAMAVIGPVMAAGQQNTDGQSQGPAMGYDPEMIQMMMAPMKLRDILGFANLPEETVEQINAQLNAIENK